MPWRNVDVAPVSCWTIAVTWRHRGHCSHSAWWVVNFEKTVQAERRELWWPRRCHVQYHLLHLWENAQLVYALAECGRCSCFVLDSRGVLTLFRKPFYTFKLLLFYDVLNSFGNLQSCRCYKLRILFGSMCVRMHAMHSSRMRPFGFIEIFRLLFIK